LVVNQYVEKKLFYFYFRNFIFNKTELCLQSIYDIIYPGDIEIVKQQLINEKKTSSNNNEDTSNESKCKKKIFLIQN
jgi:hypothetical protein